jgi:hypothetical protein
MKTITKSIIVVLSLVASVASANPVVKFDKVPTDPELRFTYNKFHTKVNYNEDNMTNDRVKETKEFKDYLTKNKNPKYHLNILPFTNNSSYKLGKFFSGKYDSMNLCHDSSIHSAVMKIVGYGNWDKDTWNSVASPVERVRQVREDDKSWWVHTSGMTFLQRDTCQFSFSGGEIGSVTYTVVSAVSLDIQNDDGSGFYNDKILVIQHESQGDEP